MRDRETGSIPLSLTAERGNYRVSRSLKAQAVLLLKQKEELVLREVSDALGTAQASLERVAATRRAVEHYQAALRAEEQKLAGGTSTVLRAAIPRQSGQCGIRRAAGAG